LICGNPTLDLHALEEGTKYEDGYSSSSQAVRWFWNVIHSFDEDEKKSFLQFISGSDRSPIDGLSKLGFTVSKNGIDDSRLPSAHTCFNHLLLPAYSSEEIMREKLKYAIAHAEGFGLR
jgi:ubiquitin-protein ligase E3 A